MMRHSKNAKREIVSPLMLIVVLCLLSGQVAPTRSPEQVVDLIEAVATGPRGDRYRLRDELTHMPSEWLIPIVVDALNNDPALENKYTRFEAYRILDRHRAETTVLGRKQLLIGLSKWGHGARALARLRGYPEIVTAIAERLQYEMPNPSKSLIEALGALGSSAREHLPLIEESFRNRDLSVLIRGAAAEAIVRIAGIEYAMDRPFVEALDSSGKYVVLGTLGYLGAETKGTFNTEAEYRVRIREVVLKGLWSKSKEVREAAMLATAPAFWEDTFVIRSRHDYELNPRLREAMEHMAAHDEDELLREQAARLLDPAEQDRGVERILRRREREAEKKDRAADHEDQPDRK